jgi:hypothetical protein
MTGFVVTVAAWEAPSNVNGPPVILTVTGAGFTVTLGCVPLNANGPAHPVVLNALVVHVWVPAAVAGAVNVIATVWDTSTRFPLLTAFVLITPPLTVGVVQVLPLALTLSEVGVPNPAGTLTFAHPSMFGPPEPPILVLVMVTVYVFVSPNVAEVGEITDVNRICEMSKGLLVALVRPAAVACSV